MSDQSEKRGGFLGRGPLFWCAMTFLSTAIVVALGLTEAIEREGLLLLMLVVPITTVVFVFLSALNLASSEDPTCVPKGEAQKRYIKRTAVFTSLYLATFAAMTFMDEMGPIPVPLRYVIAVLPGLAITGFFWSIGRLMIEEQDEFLRMLTIRQCLVATAVALSAASVWGFLEAADLVPHLDAYWVAVAWFAGLFVGALINRIEHGTWGAA